MDIQNEWIDYMAVLRIHLDTVAAISTALRETDYSTAKEAWAEVPTDDKKALWRATTKGGIFTTEERNKMKSNEWSAA